MLNLLVGCSESSSSDDTESVGVKPATTTTAQGQFFDNYVTGLQYTSGTISGITDSNGTFTYEISSGDPLPVRFYIGGIEIGTTIGKPFITPRDLMAANLEQQNLVRFLMSIDNDGDADNGGINISEITDNVAFFSWEAIDFSSDNFGSSSELINFFSDASSILSKNISLIDTLTADEHINSTYRCLVSGNYFGEFIGGDTGPIVLAVDPFSGFIAGIGWSRTQGVAVGIPFNTQALINDNNFSFIATSDDDFIFQGEINGFNTVTGIWSEDTKQGSFSLKRIAASNSSDVTHRFTGAYLAEVPQVGNIPIGAFTINILNDGTVKGELVNIVLGITQITAMSGEVNNGELFMIATNGMTLTASLDIDLLTINGVWSDPSGIFNAGTFSLNGCILK